jgi:superfamily II DNA or RNA helicase
MINLIDINENTLNEIIYINNEIKQWLPIIPGFGLYGEQLDDDIYFLREFCSSFKGIRNYRNQFILIKEQISSLFETNAYYNINKNKLIEETSALQESYTILENKLKKIYIKENVSSTNTIINNNIGKELGVKIKNIELYDQDIEGFLIKDIEDEDDEYQYYIYKDFFFLNDTKNCNDKLNAVIDNLVNKMLESVDGREKIYNNVLYKESDKLYALDKSQYYKLDLTNKRLYTWQEEASEEWIKNKYKGTFEVATGCGKTKFALYNIQKLKEQHNDLKISVLVPTVVLMNNWYKNLVEELHIPTSEIVMVGDKNKYEPSDEKDIYIYIDKSAQKEDRFNCECLSLKSYNSLCYTSRINFIIADECHHYVTENNINMFNNFKTLDIIDPLGVNYCAMGLSATLPTDFSGGKLKQYLGDVIYNYSFMKALRDKIISPINIVDVSYTFSLDENKKFQMLKNEFLKVEKELNEALTKYELEVDGNWLRAWAYIELKKYKQFRSISDEKLYELEQLYGKDAKEMHREWLRENFPNEEIYKIVSSYVNSYERLKRLLLNIEDRKNRTIELVRRHMFEKVIIFGEYISDVKEIYLELVQEFGLEKVTIYHSDLDDEQKRQALHKIGLTTTRIVCVPTAFDEGMDIPDMSVGIIFQGKRSQRQQVQRLGRIMRKAEGKKLAILYNLCNPTYGESKFLNNFIQDQLEIIQGMENSKEMIEKLQKDLELDFIDSDEKIENSEKVNYIIKKLRS